jgi:hypothetical protein
MCCGSSSSLSRTTRSTTCYSPGVVSISSGESLRRVLLANARSSAPPEVAVAVIGGFVGFVWVTNPSWLPVVAVPAVIAQATLEYVATAGRRAAAVQVG